MDFGPVRQFRGAAECEVCPTGSSGDGRVAILHAVMSTSIHLNNLTKSFGGPAPAVDDVSLRVEAGELFFLLGPSGCGKTTLLRMIAGFIEPTSGTVTFETNNGTRDVTRLPPNKRNTGMVFQSYALWPHMSVEANVGFGLTVRKIGSAEKKRRVGEALELVRMSEYASRKPNQLSGGQQQRVALARALVIRPDVLLLDEPLSNLDAKLRIELRSEIRRICKEARTASTPEGGQGMTAVYVTHDQKESLSMADRVAIMRSGKVVQIGTPRELYRDPGSAFVAEFLGETNFLPGVVQSAEALVRVSTPAGMLTGRSTRKIPTGAKAVCSIRPEAIRVGSPGTLNGNALSGKVAQTTYLGEIAQLDVRVHPGAAGADVPLKVSVINPTAAPPAGEEVSLSIDPADVVVLPAP
jgi:iron(III) transport system ATP-binding protein